MRYRSSVVLLAIAVSSSGACAARGFSLPSGEGEPFAGYQQALEEAEAGCRGVRSMSAELAISGRVNGEKVRGRVLAGLAGGDRVRLEGVAPFGPPAFILAADGSATTLLLPRDNRVLTGESSASVLEALVGVNLGPADLLAILAGCLSPDLRATGGRSFPSGWARLDLAGGGSAFLERDARGRWRIRAGVRPAMRVEYDTADGPMPTAVRLQVETAGTPASALRVGLSQVEVNVTLGPEVFVVKVPGDAVPLTLAELRRGGPIGNRR